MIVVSALVWYNEARLTIQIIISFCYQQLIVLSTSNSSTCAKDYSRLETRYTTQTVAVNWCLLGFIKLVALGSCANPSVDRGI